MSSSLRPMYELENGSLVAFELASSRPLDGSVESLTRLSEAFGPVRELPGANAFVCLSLGEEALIDPGLPRRLSAFVRATGLAPGNLCLFFSDQVCLRHGFTALNSLLTLKTSGFRIGLDIENLEAAPGLFLEMLPADVLRVDPLDVMPRDADGQVLSQLQDFVGFCSNLLMVPAARGVDNATQVSTLREAGIRIGQGHFFAGIQGPAHQCADASDDPCY